MTAQQEAAARHYAAHRDEYLARSAMRAAVGLNNLWRAANPARQAWYFANWKFKEKIEWTAWETTWNGACFKCGQAPARGVDHIVPFKHGGHNRSDNVQPSCLSCNQHKQARLPA